MQAFESPIDARMGITDFMMMHASELDEEVRNKLREFSSSPSPVDQIVNTAEFLYARSDEVGEAGRDLAGALASYCSLHGWHGMGGSEDRGGKIAQAMRRVNGEKAPAGTKFGKAEDDPAPRDQFVKQENETPVPMPAETPTPTPTPSGDDTSAT